MLMKRVLFTTKGEKLGVFSRLFCVRLLSIVSEKLYLCRGRGNFSVGDLINGEGYFY